MEALFSFLYPLVAIISCMAYVPQIISLIKSNTDAKDISISSWMLWIFSSLLALGYGAFCLQDIKFCIVTGLGLVMMVSVVCLVVYKRYIKTEQGKSLASFVSCGFIQSSKEII